MCKIDVRSRNQCRSGKATSNKYNECICILALFSRDAIRISRIMSAVVRPSLQYVSTLSHKRNVFFWGGGGRKLLNIKYVFWFCLQLLPETYLILRRTARDMIINLHRFSRKYPLFLWNFNESLNFVDIFSKKYSNIKFHENPSIGSPVVPCWRTDMTKLAVAFLNFAKAPKQIVL